MNNNALITVCVPCHNIEKSHDYLNCFKSLLKNCCEGIKLLFCNDGSSDNTGLILTQFKQKHPEIECQIITNQQNVGIASTRNILINHVQTKYFYFLDSDDMLIGKKTFHSMIKLIKNKKANLYIFKSYMKKCYGKTFSFRLPFFSKFLLKHHSSKFANGIDIVSQWNPIFIWNIIFDTEYYKSFNIHFLDGNNFNEDCVIFLYVFINTSQVYFKNKTTYKYVSRSTGLTRNWDATVYISLVNNIDYLYHLLHQSGFDNFIQSGAEKYFWFNFIFNYRKKILKSYSLSNTYQESITTFFQSLQNNGVISRNQKLFKSHKKFWKMINNCLHSINDHK